VTGAKEAAGNRLGTAGKNIGNAHRKWAFSAAAALSLRHTEPGPKELTRVENRPATGPARTIRAHKRARAVYDLLTRTTAFAMTILLQTEGRSAGEPDASPDTSGDQPAWGVLCGLWGRVFERGGTPRPGLPEP